MFGILKKLLKMLTNKKVLVILAVAAVACGSYLYMQSRKAVVVQVDQESEESVIAMTPETVEEETRDLGQAAQVMPAAPDTTENFAPL